MKTRYILTYVILFIRWKISVAFAASFSVTQPRHDARQQAPPNALYNNKRCSSTTHSLFISENDIIPEPIGRKPAFAQQTPHSGRHFRPSHPSCRKRLFRRKRFMEGWYYRLTIPERNASFAIIISIEDPGTKSPLKLACIQLIGPDDDYLVQADADDTKFWAWKHQQGLGCVFQWKENLDPQQVAQVTALQPNTWSELVQSGFQILPTQFIGKVRGHDGKFGVLEGKGNPGSCDFDFSVEPLCGWGDVNGKQRSTAGWLSSFSVFEPHWQVTLADARATGVIVWRNETYRFENAPFYAEKNWAKALPRKWFWTQCNFFQNYQNLSVTAGGGIRSIPFGRLESLGMICVHYQGRFYEGVPWTGPMEWEVDTWGRWILKGGSTFSDKPFEVQVEYHCDPGANPGLVFRAPTPDQGMVYFCRDTFKAHCMLTLWELEWNEATQAYHRKAGRPLIDRAVSNEGGAEVGGGPWWSTWAQESEVKQPIRTLLRLPIRANRMFRKARQNFIK